MANSSSARHEVPAVLVRLEVARLVVGPARVVILCSATSWEIVLEVVLILLHHNHPVDDLARFLLVSLIDSRVNQRLLLVLRRVCDCHVIVEHILQRVLDLRAQRVDALNALDALGHGVAALTEPHAVRCTTHRLILLRLFFLLRWLILNLIVRLL